METQFRVNDIVKIAVAPRLRYSSFYVRACRRISVFISYFLLKTPVTPNQVTAVSILFFIAGAVCLGSSEPAILIAGVFLIHFWHILDCVDGEIARCKNMCSLTGQYLDTVMHYFIDCILVIFPAAGLYMRYQSWPIAVFGCSAVVFGVIHKVSYDIRDKVILREYIRTMSGKSNREMIMRFAGVDGSEESDRHLEESYVLYDSENYVTGSYRDNRSLIRRIYEMFRGLYDCNYMFVVYTVAAIIDAVFPAVFSRFSFLYLTICFYGGTLPAYAGAVYLAVSQHKSEKEYYLLFEKNRKIRADF